MLTAAVQAYGSHSWIKVQQHVPGRTDVQCRERWVNILDPELKNSQWTKEVFSLLLSLFCFMYVLMI
jgi:hypothetical protein